MRADQTQRCCSRKQPHPPSAPLPSPPPTNMQPAQTNLDGGFACDVGHKEVHGDVLAVHVSVHPVLDVPGHLVCVQIVEVLECREGERK